MSFFKIMMIVSGVSAGLCVLALPLWILGVPGTENDYARGWKMGFKVILTYPVAWLINIAIYFALRNRIGEIGGQSWQSISGSIALLIFTVALVRLVQAFRTMS